MKTTTKSIKLDKSKLFGFSQPGSGKSKVLSARPMIEGKAVGGKGGGGGPPPPIE